MKQNTLIICLSKIDGGMEIDSIKISKLLSPFINIQFLAKENSFIASKKDIFNEYNIKLHTINFLSNFSINLIIKTRNIIKNNNIKNIIFFGASEIKSLYFSTLGIDINFIVMQGTTKSTSKKDFVHRLQYSNVKHFVGNSTHISNNMKKILPISKNSKLHTIYTPIDLKKDIKFKKIDEKISIIHVGRITKGKGQIEAIKSCSVLYQNNIDFEFNLLGSIHDKEYYEEIKNFLISCPYKNRIHFLGFTSNISKYLQNSDIFLFPTYGEGMSNAIIEAMAHSLIPIIYNNTSTPEFKDLGFYINLTKEDNIENLKYLLLKISKNIKVEKELAFNNHQKALDIFDYVQARKKYLALLK